MRQEKISQQHYYSFWRTYLKYSRPLPSHYVWALKNKKIQNFFWMCAKILWVPCTFYPLKSHLNFPSISFLLCIDLGRSLFPECELQPEGITVAQETVPSVHSYRAQSAFHLHRHTSHQWIPAVTWDQLSHDPICLWEDEMNDVETLAELFL